MCNSFVIVEQPGSVGGTQSSSLLQSSNFFVVFYHLCEKAKIQHIDLVKTTQYLFSFIATAGRVFEGIF